MAIAPEEQRPGMLPTSCNPQESLHATDEKTEAPRSRGIPRNAALQGWDGTQVQLPRTVSNPLALPCVWRGSPGVVWIFLKAHMAWLTVVG